jgi:hypothetical protein
MTLKKGDIIRETRTNADEMFKNTCANSVLEYQVVRVNPKTYTLKCVNGYMKGSGCFLRKCFKETTVDVYGTKTEWQLV